MINKLYISTVDHDWKDSSVSVDRHNIDIIIDKSKLIDCHTSVEDLFCENISVACNNATEIIVVDIDENVDITNDNCFAYGRLFNELLRHKDKVKNFAWRQDINYLKHTRSTDSPVLWTAGCSITAGVGVEHTDRWGTLLSKYLNLPEITLSKGGTSIFWSADQLLRSDIRENDIVVWGVTNVPRIEIARSWNFDSTTITGYYNKNKQHQYWNPDYFESETQVLFALRSILQVVNFCQKVKATLYLANMFDIAWISVMLKDFKNFIDLTQDLSIVGNTITFIDVGSDNKHPGPRQHQQYAEKLYNFIKEGK
jgi:hypothetical protein